MAGRQAEVKCGMEELCWSAGVGKDQPLRGTPSPRPPRPSLFATSVFISLLVDRVFLGRKFEVTSSRPGRSLLVH